MKLAGIHGFGLLGKTKTHDFNSARAVDGPDLPVSGHCRKHHFPAVPAIPADSGGPSLQFCQKVSGIPGIRGYGHGSGGPVSGNRTFHSLVWLVRDPSFAEK